MKPSFKTSILIAAFALSACAKDSPLLELPVAAKLTPAPELLTDRAKVQNEYESAKVDILFVMDNSASMKNHQDRLIANIDKFAEAFLKNSDVDFHIGVVKVYDSKRFSRSQPTFVPNGQLLNGFVQRGDDTVAKLQELLRVPVLDVKDGGPEYEEVFSPVRAAFSEETAQANAGFYRQDAHLAVIMITDANDSSENFDETNLQAFLDNLKNQRSEKYSVYAVLATKSDSGASCKQDPSGEPLRISNLIKITNGKKFSLCDRDYGKKLASVGSEINAKAVFNRVVELTNVPDPREPIVVACEGKTIPKGPAGWSFGRSPSDYKVVLSDAYQGCKSANAEIEVTYAKLKSDLMK